MDNMFWLRYAHEQLLGAKIPLETLRLEKTLKSKEPDFDPDSVPLISVADFRLDRQDPEKLKKATTELENIIYQGAFVLNEKFNFRHSPNKENCFELDLTRTIFRKMLGRNISLRACCFLNLESQIGILSSVYCVNMGEDFGYIDPIRRERQEMNRVDNLLANAFGNQEIIIANSKEIVDLFIERCCSTYRQVYSGEN